MSDANDCCLRANLIPRLHDEACSLSTHQALIKHSSSWLDAVCRSSLMKPWVTKHQAASINIHQPLVKPARSVLDELAIYTLEPALWMLHMCMVNAGWVFKELCHRNLCTRIGLTSAWWMVDERAELVEQLYRVNGYNCDCVSLISETL